MKILEGMDRHYEPLNEWICEAMRPHAERVAPDSIRYRFVFDKLEILMALSYAHHAGNASSEDWYWTIPGTYTYQRENRNRVLQEIRESLDAMGDESPFVTCNIFGRTAGHCMQGLKALEEFIPKLWSGLR